MSEKLRSYKSQLSQHSRYSDEINISSGPSESKWGTQWSGDNWGEFNDTEPISEPETVESKPERPKTILDHLVDMTKFNPDRDTLVVPKDFVIPEDISEANKARYKILEDDRRIIKVDSIYTYAVIGAYTYNHSYKSGSYSGYVGQNKSEDKSKNSSLGSYDEFDWGDDRFNFYGM